MLRSPLLRSLLGATLGTIVLAGTAGAASPSAFSDPALLQGGRYRTISAAEDSQGHLHIAAETTGGSIVYITDRTGTTTRRTVAAADPGNVVFRDPTLALDGNGRVHIVMQRAWAQAVDCGICSAGLFMVNDKGRARGTFPKPSQVARSGAFAPDLAIHANKLYLAFVTGMDGLVASPGTLWLKTNASGSWTARKAATGLEGFFPTPSIAVNADGKARIAFEDGAIKVAFASTKTGDFSVDTVTATDGTDARPVVVMNALDQPLLIFVQDRTGTADDGVYLRAKAGSSWAGVKVSPRVGLADAAFGSGQVTVAVGIGTTTGAGTYLHAGPTFVEEQVGSVKARGVSLANVSTVLFSTPATPRGIFVAED